MVEHYPKFMYPDDGPGPRATFQIVVGPSASRSSVIITCVSPLRAYLESFQGNCRMRERYTHSLSLPRRCWLPSLFLRRGCYIPYEIELAAHRYSKRKHIVSTNDGGKQRLRWKITSSSGMISEVWLQIGGNDKSPEYRCSCRYHPLLAAHWHFQRAESTAFTAVSLTVRAIWISTPAQRDQLRQEFGECRRSTVSSSQSSAVQM